MIDIVANKEAKRLIYFRCANKDSRWYCLNQSVIYDSEMIFTKIMVDVKEKYFLGMRELFEFMDKENNEVILAYPDNINDENFKTMLINILERELLGKQNRVLLSHLIPKLEEGESTPYYLFIRDLLEEASEQVCNHYVVDLKDGVSANYWKEVWYETDY